MGRAVNKRKAKNTIRNTLGGLFVQTIWISCVDLKLEPVVLWCAEVDYTQSSEEGILLLLQVAKHFLVHRQKMRPNISWFRGSLPHVDKLSNICCITACKSLFSSTSYHSFPVCWLQKHFWVNRYFVSRAAASSFCLSTWWFLWLFCNSGGVGEVTAAWLCHPSAWLKKEEPVQGRKFFCLSTKHLDKQQWWGMKGRESCW